MPFVSEQTVQRVKLYLCKHAARYLKRAAASLQILHFTIHIILKELVYNFLSKIARVHHVQSKSMLNNLPILNHVRKTCRPIPVSYIGLFFMRIGFHASGFTSTQNICILDRENRKKDSLTWITRRNPVWIAGLANRVVGHNSLMMKGQRSLLLWDSRLTSGQKLNNSGRTLLSWRMRHSFDKFSRFHFGWYISELMDWKTWSLVLAGKITLCNPTGHFLCTIVKNQDYWTFVPI